MDPWWWPIEASNSVTMDSQAPAVLLKQSRWIEAHTSSPAVCSAETVSLRMGNWLLMWLALESPAVTSRICDRIEALKTDIRQNETGMNELYF